MADGRTHTPPPVFFVETPRMTAAEWIGALLFWALLITACALPWTVIALTFLYLDGKI